MFIGVPESEMREKTKTYEEIIAETFKNSTKIINPQIQNPNEHQKTSSRHMIVKLLKMDDEPDTVTPA